MGRLVDEAQRLPRDLSNPWVNVSYWPEGSTHEHLLSGCTMEPGESFGEYLEDVANELAEAVLRCHEGRHATERKPEGYGQSHGQDEAQKAYAAAREQLLTRDYWRENVELQRKIEHHAIWGGPVPAAVVQPNPEDKGEWLTMVTHPITGLPAVYRSRKNTLELPWPDKKKHRQGKLGYYRRGN